MAYYVYMYLPSLFLASLSQHLVYVCTQSPLPFLFSNVFFFRSRSAEPQTLRNLGGAKNRTCEVAARREDGDVMRTRNNTGVGARNMRGVLHSWDGVGGRDNPEDSLTRVRNNTGGARNQIRPDPWGEGPSIQEDPDESLNRLRNNTGIDIYLPLPMLGLTNQLNA